jgi:hypothetical protein
MKVIFFILVCFTFVEFTWSQSYHPPAEVFGTSAIHKDSSVFIAWATGASVKRGFLQISDTNIQINGSNRVSHGELLDALGPAEGNSMNVLSLGDRGEATLTFAQPIRNGDGYDFAVFENSFQSDFLELAFVEVSSDGIHFFRFPAHSENQFVDQIYGFGLMDCRYVNNLAGKYKQGFGTPFDLSELQNDPLLDKNKITHVKVIDVVGSIDPEFTSFDSEGNSINDPFPTPFESGGFDLDAVGVIHQAPLEVLEKELLVSVFPNPTSDVLVIQLSQPARIELLDSQWKSILKLEASLNFNIDFSGFDAGFYFIQCRTNEGTLSLKRIVKY